MKEHEILLALKINKVLQKEDTIMKINKVLHNKLTVKNVVAFYSLAKCYNLATISESSLLYVQRCFSMVVETQNFLLLDFSNLAKILASSELNIHSEIKIFNAVIAWLKPNIEERSKYAKQLFSKIRFTLLSEHALEYISNCYSTISKNQEYAKELKEVCINRLKNKSSKCYKNRYCGQNMFNFLICGGHNVKSDNVVNTVNQLSGIDLNKTKVLSSIKLERRSFEAVFLKGEVYVFGGYDNDYMFIKSVAKYSPFTNTWYEVANMFDKRRCFCACAFVDKIFILGGYSYNDDDGYILNKSCLQYETKNKNWKEISGMTVERDCAACTVIKGNIVVSGGTDNFDNDLKSV